MIRRRSLLKAAFLGVAVAFPVSKLAIVKPKDEGPTYDDLVKVGRIMDEKALPDDYIDALARELAARMDAEIMSAIEGA